MVHHPPLTCITVTVIHTLRRGNTIGARGDPRQSTWATWWLETIDILAAADSGSLVVLAATKSTVGKVGENEQADGCGQERETNLHGEVGAKYQTRVGLPADVAREGKLLPVANRVVMD